MDMKSTSHLDYLNSDMTQDKLTYNGLELSNLWAKNLNLLQEYSFKLIDDCFFSIRVKLMIKILNQISKENRLSKYDEKIFDYFHHLMWYYYQTISLYEQNRETIRNSKAKEIIEGICTVLSAQLNQFEENQQQEYIYIDKRAVKNPIRIEKDQIIINTKNYVLKSVDHIRKDYVNNQNSICFDYVSKKVLKPQDQHDCYIEILEDIYMGIINNNIDKLYSLYTNITKESIEKINNLQFRKAANFYYESIKQEKENLEIIIKVQVNALEDELKYMDIEPLEHQKIHEILNTLIEAYQHLGKEIEDLSLYFKESESVSKEIELLTRDEFIKYIVEEGAKKYIQDLDSKEFPSSINEFNININNIKQNLDEQITKYVNDIIDYRLVCYYKNNDISSNLNNFISEKEYMVDEFLDCFIYIKQYCDGNFEQLISTKYSDIFKGIYETIEIKLESLEENKNIFLETLKSNNISNNTTINQRDKKTIVEKMLSYWYDEMPITNEQFLQTIKQLYYNIHSDEIMLSYISNLKRQYQQQNEYINKKYIQFLREQLLFELTTYEEILNYSVCKLRDEQEPDVVKIFVETMDTVDFRIEELLEKYNIYTIKPKPYDIFDGKEHEVLMAEKNDDFEKGQIIKLMNTGYKYNNAVIIRANVIAAK